MVPQMGSPREIRKVGSLKEYETVFVLHPNLDESRVEEEVAGVKQTILSGSGEVVDIERWGRRKLAYSIQKVHEGIYTLIRFRSEAGVIGDLERRYRLREDVLRHLTVVAQGPPGSEIMRRREAEAAPQSAVTDDGPSGSRTDCEETVRPMAVSETAPEESDPPRPDEGPIHETV
ncbi:MAG: 30S ribosomal protein S6 [Candidatus Eisenbacteria bacterium]|nr:30S ribosomal protein S6 [Candidatus Eisenbacteria bacterium]